MQIKLEKSIELSAFNDLTKMLKSGTNSRRDEFAKLYISAENAEASSKVSLYYTNGVVAVRYTADATVEHMPVTPQELNIAIPLLNNKFSTNKIHSITLPFIVDSGVTFYGDTEIAQIATATAAYGYQERIQGLFDRSNQYSMSAPIPAGFTLDYTIISDLLKFYRKLIGDKELHFVLEHSPDGNGACKISHGDELNILIAYRRV